MIDAHVLVGPTPVARDPSAYGRVALQAELTAHGIRAGLVASRASAGYRAELANDEVLEVVNATSGVRLYPVFSLNPVQYLGWRPELERALASGAVALRFFPDQQGWDVESAAFESMLDALRRRLPLLLPIARFGDPTRIGRATASLDVPVLLLGAHYTQLGDCLAALERWPHLYLETSRLGQFRGVETVVRAVGADRLLLGSGAPTRPIQSVLDAILTANIAESEKQAILGGSASRLFGIQLEPFELGPATQAQDLVDVHGHLGGLPFPVPATQPAELVESATRRGICQTIVSSSRAIFDHVEAGNRQTLAAAAETPNDSLRAYVVVNPNDLEGACSAMDRAYASGAAVGAKLHSTWSGQPTAAPASVALLEQIARRERPLLIHVDGPGWAQAIEDMGNTFPRWKVIVAHGGPGTPVHETADLVQRTGNVYLELATTFPDLPVIRDVVRRAGRDRLLFGTDSPLIDPAYMLGVYADAGVDLSCTTRVAREVFGL